MGIQALLLISTSCITMNLIISFVLFYSISMVYADKWVSIGEKDYNFYPVPLSQGNAISRCFREGGQLFEPKDEKTNTNVFIQAGSILGNSGGQVRRLWIGVSDVVREDEYTYLSDNSLVTFTCQGTLGLTNGGCWNGNPTAGGTASNCVSGSSFNDGRWSIQPCAVATVFGSICERDGKITPATPAPPPPPPPTASGSSCLESGTAVLLGMLFFCYQ